MGLQLSHLKELYIQLLHSMQTGVAFYMQKDPAETQPKHLRVGVNSALESSGAIVELLIKKGIISEEEYFTILNEKVQEDVDKYSKLLGGVNLI